MVNGTGCADIQPPTLVCAVKGCRTMKFKAVSVIGIMSEDTKIHQMEEGSDLGFIDKFLEKHKKQFCTVEDPCYLAFDDTMNGRVDLTSRVELGTVTLTGIVDRLHAFSISYLVRDDAGKTTFSSRDMLTHN